jgi:NADPH-dependent F420 reductase
VTVGDDEIVIGSRDAARAQETAAGLGGGRVSGATNDDAVRGADLAVLAVNADGALETARGVAAALGTTPLLSVASAIRFEKGVGMLPDPDAVSLAERVQAVVEAPVAAGLHSIAAANLAEDVPDEDALVCGDDAEAKALALELAGKLVGGRALDAGPLASARALEGLTAVIVNLNRRYKAHAGMRVTGIE